MARWRSIEAWVERSDSAYERAVAAFGAAARVACLRIDQWLLTQDVSTPRRDYRWAVMAGSQDAAVVQPAGPDGAQSGLFVVRVPPNFETLPVQRQRDEVVAQLLSVVRLILGPGGGELVHQIEAAVSVEPWTVTLEATTGHHPELGPSTVEFTVDESGSLSGYLRPSTGDAIAVDVPRFMTADIVTLQRIGKGLFAEARAMKRRSPAATPPARGSVADRLAQARDSRTRPDGLTELARDNSPTVRHAVARNPSAPAEALLALSGDSRKSTRLAVAENPSTPDAALSALVSDTYNQIRWTVPLHPRLAPEVQHAIATADDPMARENLAGHPNLSREVARALAADSNASVRSRVAAHTSQADLLAELIADPNPRVRAGATENPRLTQEQRRALKLDRTKLVRDAYAWRAKG